MQPRAMVFLSLSVEYLNEAAVELPVLLQMKKQTVRGRSYIVITYTSCILLKTVCLPQIKK